MGQSKLLSMLEAIANTALGTFIAFAAQLAYFHAVGLEVSMEQNVGLVAVMTVVSIIRSYVLRRVFNQIK